MFMYSVSRHRSGQKDQYHQFAGNIWRSYLRAPTLTEDKEEADLTFEGIIKEGESEAYEIRLNVYKMEYDHCRVFQPKREEPASITCPTCQWTYYNVEDNWCRRCEKKIIDI